MARRDKLQSPVRLANKNDELIYDIDNTDVDDRTATGTTFRTASTAMWCTTMTTS